MSYQQQSASEGSYGSRTSPSMYVQGQMRNQRESQGAVAVYPSSAGSQIDNGMSAMMNSFSQTHLNIPAGNVPTANSMPVNNQYLYYTGDGQIVCFASNGMYSGQPVAPNHLDGSYGYQPGLPYPPHAAYPAVPGYLQGYPMLPYTPARPGFMAERADIIHKDVPGLENRRGSYSTNESAPGTPFYGPLSNRDQVTHIAAADRSPVYSTPSPQIPLNHTIQTAKPLPYKTASIINFDLDALLQQAPAIPPAVPAVFTPRENMRTLEQSLSNPIYGNRNVYIRGLHPNTNDETLAAYATRFGRVETSKAIIDTSTGACKGFGFAKYCNVRDSEMCIRGFYKLGYEVGFARESFNSRLKAQGDNTSTNLYVSNLPKDMNEMELGAIFMDYKVSSSRILHDAQGNSRGVGFARFESREICEEIIKKFHGQPIGDDGLLLQVRYADTKAQKDLKQVTSERRQFRTTEYNVSAYGTAADVIALSPTMSSPGALRMAQIAHHLPQSSSSSSWKRDLSTSGSSCSVSGRSAGSLSGANAGSDFKDIDALPSKTSATPRKCTDTNKQAESLTPTVSEDGSGDEGATIHCLSPTPA